MIQDRLDRLDEADRVEATPHGDRIEHGSMHLASLPGACMKAGEDEYFHGPFFDSAGLATDSAPRFRQSVVTGAH
jgi:hypothetical protein